MGKETCYLAPAGRSRGRRLEVNDQSETERDSTISHWFGLDRLRLSDGGHAIDVTVGPGSHWDRSHLRRLRQSGDLPGMVPIIDSDFSADGKPFAVTPVVLIVLKVPNVPCLARIRVCPR